MGKKSVLQSVIQPVFQPVFQPVSRKFIHQVPSEASRIKVATFATGLTVLSYSDDISKVTSRKLRSLYPETNNHGFVILPKSVPILSVALFMPKEEVEEELAKGEKDVDEVERGKREMLYNDAVQIRSAELESLEMLDRVAALPSYKIAAYFGCVTLKLIKVIQGFINAFL